MSKTTILIVKYAQARLDDAITLYRQKRYQGAIYLCGYVVELAFKYKICKKLGWNKHKRKTACHRIQEITRLLPNNHLARTMRIRAFE